MELKQHRGYLPINLQEDTETILIQARQYAPNLWEAAACSNLDLILGSFLSEIWLNNIDCSKMKLQKATNSILMKENYNVQKICTKKRLY